MKKFRITSIPQNKKLNTFAGGGEPCPKGYMKMWPSGECISLYNTDAQNLDEFTISKQRSKKNLKNKVPKNLINPSNAKSMNYDWKKEAMMPDSFRENVGEFIDPTGHTSWDDAYRAYTAWDESGEKLPTLSQAADMFGAVPVLGKFGKLKYLVEGEGLVKSAYKYFPWQQIVNTFDTVDDIETDNVNEKKNGGSLDTYAGGGGACPRGYIRDASGKCVPYNFNDVQAVDSYTGMYGGYDSSGVKNLKQVSATAKKGKKFSDYVLRGGKSKADVARNLGKTAGQYFGMPGEAIEPTNFTKAGLEKYTKTVKDAKKNFDAEAKNYQDYLKSKEKVATNKMDTRKYADKYNEKNWSQYDQTIAKGSGPDADYSAKEARQNWGDPEEWKKFVGLVGNAAMGITGLATAGAMGPAGAALLENPVVQGGLTAYGVYDATTNTLPEAYRDFSEGRYLEGLGNTAMAGLDLYVPGFGKGVKTGIKGLGKVANYVKNIEPAGPGPLMLLKPTADGMVQKNIPYYKQLLDSYDSKKMSASDKRFYNALINTANKQNGMLTQAQLNELDRLKTGNFDFGKRGYNKESLIQVEPESPNTVSSINLEPVPENLRGPNAYKIKKDNEWIGDFDLEKLKDGNWGIGNVYVLDELQGKGLGKEAFIQANNLLQKEGKGVLHSSGNFYGDDAKRVWESLVKEGKAEKIGEDSWRFKSPESSGPSNQIISTESAKKSSDSFADEPKKYLTDKQSKEQGYKIENDLESDERLILNKNGNYAGQIEILTPETSSTGEKFAGINIDLDYDHRGKKLSKAMYDAILDRAKEQGIDGIISIDSMLDSPEQSKAIRKYFDGEYTSDPKLLKDIHKKIDGINEDTIRMFGKDEPLIEKPDKVYIIRRKKQATESKTKRTLSERLQDIDSLLGEGLGYLVNTKNTQRKIDEGNTWLKNWIEHPETQAKIDNDFEYVRDRAMNNSNPWGILDAHDLAYMQAKGFEPNSKIFPLKKQFRDYKNKIEPIHSGNYGVSYLHQQDPYVRHGVNNGSYTPFERYGSWISRSPFTKNKVSTTIHEGTHDWVNDFTLTNSGQKSFIESNYTKEQLDNLRQWEDLNSKGIKPETVMGKKKAWNAYMSDPAEVHARIMELRKHFNLTPKSTQEITTEQAKKILKEIKKSKTPINNDFVDVVHNDPEKLKNLFKGLWAAPIATAGAVGTAAMLANPFQGSDGLQQQKKGGATKNFIELELPKNKIQDYINQGYIVEEID